MCQLITPAVSVVHAIDITCSVTKAYDFLRDVQQWLPWVMPQVQAVLPLPLGQWLVRTPSGLAKLRPRGNQALGTMEYELPSRHFCAAPAPHRRGLYPPHAAHRRRPGHPQAGAGAGLTLNQGGSDAAILASRCGAS